MKYDIIRARSNDRKAILEVLEHFNMHHVPSVEMEELDLSKFFVVIVEGKVVGVAGYKMLSATEGKTTLMGVLPEYNGHGIGRELQHLRMKTVYEMGAKTMVTNADRPETIVWYKKHFGYKKIGELEKLCSFGLDEVDRWTTLKTDLTSYFEGYEASEQHRKSYIDTNDAYPLAEYEPLIINVCLTGMVPTKNQNRFLPVSVDEIIEDAVRCYDAGARAVHLHARGEDGRPTPDVRYYEKIIAGIRKERPDLICCATTSGRNWGGFEQRSEVLYLDEASRPDMASLTTGSLNFLSGPSTNSITMIQQLAIAMKEQGVKPELEVFDLGMINLVKYLERNRIIEGRKYINILLGNINTAPADLNSLSTMVNALPMDSVWAGAGLGQFQLPVNSMAIAAGGHVRVGLEDNIYYDYNKTVTATNVMLVERVTRLAEELQRPIATPVQARSLMGL